MTFLPLRIGLLAVSLLLLSLGQALTAGPSSPACSSDGKTGLLLAGIEVVREQHQGGWEKNDAACKLLAWYRAQPMVASVSMRESCLTVRFTDGSSAVLMNIMDSLDEERQDPISVVPTVRLAGSGLTSLVLNPDQYAYGARSCREIMRILSRCGFSNTYEANSDVTLDLVRRNLTADVVVFNTHAGYWDIDGDGVADSVVIATGEPWTNQTTEQYAFDCQQGFIVEGVVGARAFIAFTPGFIQYYYNDSFPGSLVYMATCESAADDSMANAFLAEGAGAYVGWTSSTTSWTNRFTSVLAFRLLAHHLPVSAVCGLIRSGGLCNRWFHSILTYFGNGDYRLPRT